MSLPLIPEEDTTKGKWSKNKKKNQQDNNDKNITYTFDQVDELADYIVEEFAIKTIRETKVMWVFRGKYYDSYADSLIEELLTNKELLGGKDISKGKLLQKIRGKSYIDKKEFRKPIEYYTYVNMDNCVYDIKEDKFYPHDPKYNFTYILPFPYIKSACCTTFMSIVSGMSKDYRHIDELQKWFGYHLVPGTKYQKAMFIVGPEATGKGKLLFGLEQIIGEGNYSAHSLADLNSPTKYFIQDIEYKLANIKGDQDTVRLSNKDIGMFLAVTGEDTVSGRSVQQIPRTFRPNTKFTWAYNKFPYTDIEIFSRNEFWRRIIIFETKKYFIRPDENLESELIKERSGIFNWSAEGYRILEKEGFKDYRGDDDRSEKMYRDIKKKWIDNMNIHIKDKIEKLDLRHLIIEDEG